MPAIRHETILATMGRSLPGFCHDIGADLPKLAKDVGIDTASFQKDGVRISLSAFTELLEQIASTTGHENAGIKFAEHFAFGDSGVFGFGMLNCNSLHKALMFYTQYQRLIADYTFFDIVYGEQIVSIKWRDPGSAERTGIYADFRAALRLRMIRRYLGQQYTPHRVELVRSAPANLHDHLRTFGNTLTFNSIQNEIALPSNSLNAQTDVDVRLFSIMKLDCDHQLHHLQVRKTLLLRIKEIVLSTLPREIKTLSAVSSELAISERSLQRRLQDLGESFGSLVDKIRKELSDDLLLSRSTIADISVLCGYSNQSAYTRAATIWYGEPPSARRRRLMQSI